MPPAPRAPVISYGPRRVPEESAIRSGLGAALILTQTLRAEAPPVDPVLPHLVIDDARRRLEQPGRPGAVAARHLQGVLDQILLERLERCAERARRRTVGRVRRLQRRRQMVRVQDLAFADE